MLAPLKMTFYCRGKDGDGVYHTFPVDSTASHDTAKSWATERHGHWEHGKYVYEQAKEPTVFEFENTGFDHVTIQSLDIRGQGGRAYQVILEKDGNKFRVDLREDTLLDVIWNTGIQAGGRLNGSFCFVKDGAQTNLIREGTEKHKRAIEEREKRETFSKTLKRSELKPGHLYSTLTGSSQIFLGFVYTCDVNEDTGEVSKPYKGMLFADNYEKVIKFLEDGVMPRNEEGRRVLSSYYFKVMKSHSFKIEGEKLVEVNLSDYIPRINKLCEEDFTDKMNTKNYSRYFSDFNNPLVLARMAVDKKDVSFPEGVGKQIIRKINEYYNRW